MPHSQFISFFVFVVFSVNAVALFRKEQVFRFVSVQLNLWIIWMGWWYINRITLVELISQHLVFTQQTVFAHSDLLFDKKSKSFRCCLFCFICLFFFLLFLKLNTKRVTNLNKMRAFIVLSCLAFAAARPEAGYSYSRPGGSGGVSSGLSGISGSSFGIGHGGGSFGSSFSSGGSSSLSGFGGVCAIK